MYFTREPIIETIITPREGFKLVIRNSKQNNQDEYCVEAVEVVSFGQATFLRSLERPKSFLLPLSDYEVVETRETRVMLKHTALGIERGTKIAIASPINTGSEGDHSKEKKETMKEETKEASLEEAKTDKRRDRRRSRRKRVREDKEGVLSPVVEGEEKVSESADSVKTQEEKKALLGSFSDTAPVLQLLPPPEMLISQSLSVKKNLPILSPPELSGAVASSVVEAKAVVAHKEEKENLLKKIIPSSLRHVPTKIKEMLSDKETLPEANQADTSETKKT